VRGPARYG